MGRLMFNAHVQCSIWYADDHIVLLAVIALGLVAVRCMCKLDYTPPALCPEHSSARGG